MDILDLKAKIHDNTASDEEYEEFIRSILKQNVLLPMLTEDIPQLFVSSNGKVTIPVFISRVQLAYLPKEDVEIRDIPFLKAQGYVTGKVDGILIDPFEKPVFWDKETIEIIKKGMKND